MTLFNSGVLILLTVMLHGCGGGGGGSDGSSNNTSLFTVYNTAPLEIDTVFKTEQVKSYNLVGVEIFDNSIKDDGFYQKGVVKSFTRNAADNTVTDNVIGLIWQDNTDVTAIIKPWLTSSNFTNANYNDTTGDTATTYCSVLSLGGNSNWRLPTVIELMSITNKGASDPAINPVFLNTSSDQRYWTSTSTTDLAKARYVYFYNGHIYLDDKNISKYVRCVRGSLPAPASKKLTRDNTTETVSDDATKLMWQDNTIVGSTWLDTSILYCENLSLAGHGDWRLPNVHELYSIADSSQNLYRIYPVFLKTKSLSYWSSTSYNINLTSAWDVSFNSGSVGFGSKVSGSLKYIRCVRDEV